MTIPEFLTAKSQPPPPPNNNTTLSYQLSMTTPAFIGGADQNKTEGIRTPSLKALLRWWWRATVSIDNVAELATQEGLLFGSANTGQGCRLIMPNTKAPTCDLTVDKQNEAALGYLLGMGLYHHQNGVGRPATFLTADTPAELHVHGPLDRNDDSNNNFLKDVRRAVLAWELFGGIGARSRRGWGGLSFGSSFSSPHKVKEAIQQLLEQCPTQPRAWSSLCPKTQFAVHSKPFSDWRSALLHLGSKMMELRSSLGGMGPDYGEDHNLMWDYVNNGASIPVGPQRLQFGLPHNYFFRKSQKKAAVNWTANNNAGPRDKRNRRASPLLLKAVRLQDNQYAAVAIIMDGDFLPANAGIALLSPDQNPQRVQVPNTQLLNNYLSAIA